MSEEHFIENYLICLDKKDDINHVIGRCEDIEEAYRIAEDAKVSWPGQDIYVTVEKILVKPKRRKKKDQCLCGKNVGGCIGVLSCSCSAIAACKQVTLENPLDYENFEYTPAPETKETTIEVVSIKRGVVEIKISSWKTDETIRVSTRDIPQNITLEVGKALLADVNTDAATAEQLIINNIREAST